MTPKTFEPTAVRYIKLGSGGAWAEAAIRDGVIPFGFPEAAHDACARGDWDAVARQLAEAGRGRQAIAEDLRELRAFYEADPQTLWVTFADGHLWWAFADGPPRPADDPSPGTPTRYRMARGGWRRDSLTGEPLFVRTLSSVLTKTANYRRTVCDVPAAAYLLRRIRGEPNPVHEEAVAVKARMQDIARRMIAELHWAEFETLVDLMFARGGWRRTSTLGKTMPDVDLILDQPVTGERAWVQVKSRATQSALDDYLGRFERDGSCERFFFVCHSPAGALVLEAGPGRHLWAAAEVAERAIDVGLFDWLVERTR